MKFSIKKTADLVTFTGEILNGKLHFLFSVIVFIIFPIMLGDIVYTEILIQLYGNWRGLKGRLAHSTASTNLLSPKMATESGLLPKVFPAENKQKLSFQFGSGDGRF